MPIIRSTVNRISKILLIEDHHKDKDLDGQ